jgi:hypothetical protein
MFIWYSNRSCSRSYFISIHVDIDINFKIEVDTNFVFACVLIWKVVRDFISAGEVNWCS